MSWVAAAVIGSAVVGGVASNSASKRAAEGAEKGQDILAQSRVQGRADVNRLFPQAQASQTKGFEESRDFITGQLVPQQTQPFIGGNMAAQNQVARGLPQIQNAIMGNPVDLSGFTARQIGSAPSFNTDIYKPQEVAPTPAAEPFQFDLDAFNKQFPTIGGNFSGGFDPYSKGNRFGFSVGNRPGFQEDSR